MITIGKFRFSWLEINEMLLSAVFLAFIFGYPFSGCNSVGCVLAYTLVLTVIIGPAFILHECAHKLVAQSYDCWSEYRMSKGFLLLALIMKMTLGVALAVPGATYFSPFVFGIPFIKLKKEHVGKIAIAGILTNVVLAIIFFLLGPYLGVFGAIAAVGAEFNIQLALFNLIPLNPFDGGKVMDWSWTMWLRTVIAVLLLQQFIVR